MQDWGGISGNDIETAADDLLGALAKNKAQQMCKSTIHLCIEFVVSVFTLVSTIQTEAANEAQDHSSQAENDSSDENYYDDDNGDGRRIGGAGVGKVPIQVYLAASLAAAWAIALGFSLLVSMFKKRKYSTIKEVEEAFSKSNKMPLVEAVYGMYLCKNYTSPESRAFPCACVLWIVYFTMLIILFYLITHLATSSTTALTSLQIALQLFRISSDITEYYARTNLEENRLQQSPNGRRISEMTQNVGRWESRVEEVRNQNY